VLEIAFPSRAISDDIAPNSGPVCCINTTAEPIGIICRSYIDSTGATRVGSGSWIIEPGKQGELILVDQEIIARKFTFTMVNENGTSRRSSADSDFDENGNLCIQVRNRELLSHLQVTAKQRSETIKNDEKELMHVLQFMIKERAERNLPQRQESVPKKVPAVTPTHGTSGFALRTRFGHMRRQTSSVPSSQPPIAAAGSRPGTAVTKQVPVVPSGPKKPVTRKSDDTLTGRDIALTATAVGIVWLFSRESPPRRDSGATATPRGSASTGPPFTFVEELVKCPTCGGDGRKMNLLGGDGGVCPKCRGSGRVVEKFFVRDDGVKIPY